MRAFWHRLTRSVPSETLVAWSMMVVYMGFVAWDQSHWWRLKEDYGFGWLVPIFVAFVVHDRWPRIVAALASCAAPETPRVGDWRMTGARALAWVALVGGGMVFFLGAFYRAGAGPSYPGTLGVSAGTAAMTLAMVFIHAPRPARSGGRWERDDDIALVDDPRLRLVALFVFPALVWLVSAPMVSIIENNLSRVLLRIVTTVVFQVFDFVGLAIEQRGNVLHLPKGDVGVAEACSGIRSLTACLFAGSFLSAVFLDRLWKKVVLVGSAMGFAIVTNLMRGMFLTGWAYAYGPEAIHGFVHDTAGYAVLGITVVGLLCLLKIMDFFAPPVRTRAGADNDDRYDDEDGDYEDDPGDDVSASDDDDLAAEGEPEGEDRGK